jgi:molybdopterin-guanine dinucleotide biosynthesis protein A
MSAEAPLFGLVLAGGASTRMQRDKAAIEYHGQSQLHWTFQLLSHVCAATFVSVRPDQREEPTRAGLPQIVDRLPGIGPIAGISAAMQAHPKAAWLVVACDLPFLNETTLRHLLEHRDSTKLATAYRSSHDGLPEPLCAVWEPLAREPLLAYIAAGKQCPRKFLINADATMLDLPDARALDNVNTADEYRTTVAQIGGARRSAAAHASGDGARASEHSRHVDTNSPGQGSIVDVAIADRAGRFAAAPAANDNALAGERGRHAGASAARQSTSPTGALASNASHSAAARSAGAPGATHRDDVVAAAKARTLRVQYYAILREQAGRSEETLDTTASTPAELYDELRQRHSFQLTSAQLKVALNSEFSDWHTPLRHGDTVVFIPPVAGG